MNPQCNHLLESALQELKRPLSSYCFDTNRAIERQRQLHPGGHRPGRKAGALVILVAGQLVLYVERGGKTLLSWTADPSLLGPATAALAGAVRAGALGKLTVERADGGGVYESPLAQALEQTSDRLSHTLEQKSFSSVVSTSPSTPKDRVVSLSGDRFVVIGDYVMSVYGVDARGQVVRLCDVDTEYDHLMPHRRRPAGRLRRARNRPRGSVRLQNSIN